MFEMIGMLVVGLAVIAIAIALLVLVIKVALVLLPVALFVGAICLFGLFFCTDDSENETTTVYHNSIEQIESQILKTRNPAQQEFHEKIISLTRQKWGVNLDPIRPEIDSAIAVVVQAYCNIAENDNFKPLITSANDYEGHAAKSAHYTGAAIDFRIKDMGNLANRKELVKMIRDELDDRFLVLHEDIGNLNEHLHIQLRKNSYNHNIVWR